MGSSGTIECQAVRILDADGALLTAATTTLVDEAGTIVLTEVDDHGGLMDYYFGRGERVVVIEHDGVTAEGVLDTCWRSASRGWWVGLRQPLATQPFARDAEREPAPTNEVPSLREQVADNARAAAPLAR